MLYKFKSKSAGDVIMTGPGGDQVLRLLGREPSGKGIIEAADMPAAIATLERAVATDEAAQDEARAKGEAVPAGGGDGVSLRQRVWPLVDMMKRSQPKGHDIVWGV